MDLNPKMDENVKMVLIKRKWIRIQKIEPYLLVHIVATSWSEFESPGLKIRIRGNDCASTEILSGILPIKEGKP